MASFAQQNGTARGVETMNSKAVMKCAKANVNATPYPEVWGICDAYKTFDLGDGGLSSEAIDHARRTVLQHIDRQRSRHLGYQCNMHVNAEKFMSHYLDTLVCMEYAWMHVGDIALFNLRWPKKAAACHCSIKPKCRGHR
jgi:hypothetical protein